MQNPFTNPQTKPLSIGISLFLLIFTLIRLPFYLILKVPGIVSDTIVYERALANVLQDPVRGGDLYNGGFGYFMALMYQLSNSVNSIIIAQSIISLVVAVFSIYTIYRFYPKLTLAFSLACMVAYSGIVFLNSETTIQTEANYCNFILAFLMLIIWTLKTEKPLYWFLSLAMLGITIFYRTGGVFLGGVLLIVIAYVFAKQFPKRTKWVFIAPLIIGYLAFMGLIGFKSGHFSLFPTMFKPSPYPYMLIMQPDESYPSYVNKTIEKQYNTVLSPAEIQSVRTSWNLDSLSIIFINSFTPIINPFFPELENQRKLEKEATGKEPPAWNLEQLKDVASEKYPDRYRKFFYSQLKQFFECLDPKKSLTYPYLNSYTTEGQAKLISYLYDNFTKSNATGKFAYFNAPQINPEETATRIDTFEKSYLSIMVRSFHSVYQFLFQKVFWVYLQFALFLLVLLRLFQTRFKNPDVVLVFIVIVINISSAIITCSTQNGMIRYALPTIFTYYFAPVLAVAIIPKEWLEFLKKKEKTVAPNASKEERVNVSTQKKNPLKNKKK